MYIKADLKTFDLTQLGKFDVILMDPPWEEYYKRRLKYDVVEPYWTLEEIQALPIEEISENCSFLFLWVGSEGLDVGRALFRKWGFKRCEDIVWLKTNKNYTSQMKQSKKGQAVNDPTTILQRVKEHCLVGLKGDVRRASDSYFIHANIDTDVIVDEEPPFGATDKPKEIYQIIERFCLGRKRLELFGGPNCIRSGWLTIGNDMYDTYYDYNTYQSWFENDRYLGTTNEIENLRPKSPKSGTNPALKDDLPTNMPIKSTNPKSTTPQGKNPNMLSGPINMSPGGNMPFQGNQNLGNMGPYQMQGMPNMGGMPNMNMQGGMQGMMPMNNQMNNPNMQNLMRSNSGGQNFYQDVSYGYNMPQQGNKNNNSFF